MSSKLSTSETRRGWKFKKWQQQLQATTECPILFLCHGRFSLGKSSVGCVQLFHLEYYSRRRDTKMRKACLAFFHLRPEVACSVASAFRQLMEVHLALVQHGRGCFLNSSCKCRRQAADFPVLTWDLCCTEICSTCMNYRFMRCINPLSLKNFDVCEDIPHRSGTMRGYTDAEIGGNLSVIYNNLVESAGVVKGRSPLALKETLRKNAETASKRWSGKRAET